MSDFAKTMAAAASGMRAQSTRLRLTAENVANADTPGYRRKTVSFEEMYNNSRDTRAVAAGPVQLDRSDLERVYQPNHPLAGVDGYYEGSNVNLMVEVADGREAGRSYEANLKMFDQARQMASSVLGLLRK